MILCNCFRYESWKGIIKKETILGMSPFTGIQMWSLYDAKNAELLEDGRLVFLEIML